MELAAPPWSLNHIQPYTVIDDKCNENICVGCLADVEAGFEELPQMRKAAVHLQHAYEHLKFEPKKLWIVAAAPLLLVLILVGTVLMESW